MKRVRIDKNIEKSTVAGSTPVTDASNELNYVAPGTLGQQLEINASGVPEYKSTVNDLKTVNRAFSKVGSSQATNSDDVLITDAIYHSGNTILGGTSTPSATLQIDGTATEATDLATSKSQNALFIRPFLSSGWGLSFGSVSGQKQYLQAVSSGGNGVKELLLNPYGGNVGVGTDTPVGKQEITLNTGGISLRISRPADSNFDIYQGGGITYFDASNANAQIDFKIAGTSAMRISNSRNVLIKKTTDSGEDFQVNGTASFSGNVKSSQYNLSSLNTAPASSTSTGVLGEIRITSGFIYVCIATNTWVRATLTTF